MNVEKIRNFCTECAARDYAEKMTDVTEGWHPEIRYEYFVRPGADQSWEVWRREVKK